MHLHFCLCLITITTTASATVTATVTTAVTVAASPARRPPPSWRTAATFDAEVFLQIVHYFPHLFGVEVPTFLRLLNTATTQNKVVQLNFTPEIEIFCMLFVGSLSIFSMTSLKEHI